MVQVAEHEMHEIGYPPLPESRRTAHRVFVNRKKRDNLNPFRHIPWDYTKESTEANGSAGEEGYDHGRQRKSKSNMSSRARVVLTRRRRKSHHETPVMEMGVQVSQTEQTLYRAEPNPKNHLHVLDQHSPDLRANRLGPAWA